MLTTSRPTHADAPAALLSRCPVHASTPLLHLPRLASALGLNAILAKDEGCRPLGSFKALGGVYAALRALSRATGLSTVDLVYERLACPRRFLPTLVCASDGNHGLAVAAAARLVGARARIFLPAATLDVRTARIAAKGAEVIRVSGTYDDAVRAAADSVEDGSALLIADTGDDPRDQVLADVMAGYSVIGEEISVQLAEAGHRVPTHLFIQAGVGGLAAALAARLHGPHPAPTKIVLAEPEAAACVGAALAAGHPVQMQGTLRTGADMLSCGRASAPALTILRRHEAAAIAVPETALAEAPRMLSANGGPTTTPSGAAGLAALSHALAEPALTRSLSLGSNSRILLIVTEAPSA